MLVSSAELDRRQAMPPIFRTLDGVTLVDGVEAWAAQPAILQSARSRLREPEAMHATMTVESSFRTSCVFAMVAVEEAARAVLTMGA